MLNIGPVTVRGLSFIYLSMRILVDTLELLLFTGFSFGLFFAVYSRVMLFQCVLLVELLGTFVAGKVHVLSVYGSYVSRPACKIIIVP